MHYSEEIENIFCVSITVWEHGENVFYFFYKITRIENENIEIAFFIEA